MKTLWNWIKSLFTGEKIGIIWRNLFSTGKGKLRAMVNDPDTQEAAFELAKKLMSSELTNDQKREAFNSQLLAWAKDVGKELTEAAVNNLRENAVFSFKCKEECEGCCEA